MNSIHLAFASEPALPLTSDGLFEVLDRIPPQERYNYLSPVIQDVLMGLEWRTTAKDHDAAYEEMYQAFKEKCLGNLRNHVGSQFLAYAIVSRTLAWLCIYSDPKHAEQAIENNREQLRRAQRDLPLGTISQAEYESIVRECEERINNIPSDWRLTKERYDTFCSFVVRQFLYYPPSDE